MWHAPQSLNFPVFEPPQGDELITTCTYNTEDRSRATVVSAGAAPLALWGTPGWAPAQSQAETQPEAKGGWEEGNSQGSAACSGDVKVLIVK